MNTFSSVRRAIAQPLLVLAGILCGMQMAGAEAIPAFPGAEGGGRYATGGRGGTVYYVTNLNDSGSGSLREAVGKKGARTILFKVSGIIELKSRLSISNGDLTIAGQSAPGDGICIKNNSVYVGADNVIIRFIRFRPGDAVDGFEDDAIWGRNVRNVILDHCSMSYSVDECASFYGNKNFTMQWCLLSESLNTSQHAKGAHGYGGIWGGENVSFHHNLLAHHNSRNPRFNGFARSGLKYNTYACSKETMDYRNNVVYNWGGNSTYGGEAAGQYNMINNYYKYGPATSAKSRLVQIDKDSKSYPVVVNGVSRNLTHGVYYLSGNYIYGNAAATANNWSTQCIKNNSGEDLSQCRLNEPLAFEYIPTHTAEMAFEKVLAYAGASYARDAQDARVCDEALEGTATYTGSKTKKQGLIDTPGDAGGYCAYNTTVAPKDSDGDGIPDDREEQYGCDPAKKDAQSLAEDGYSFLEHYLNDLVAHITEGEYEDVISALPGVQQAVAEEAPLCFLRETGELTVRAARPVSRLEVLGLDGRRTAVFDGKGRTELHVTLSREAGPLSLLSVRYEDGRQAVVKIQK